MSKTSATMRICVVQSSYEGTNSPFQKHDSMPNPGYYVDENHHTFHQRHVRKFSQKNDIDEIVSEGFDMYMNFMWGQVNDSVAGIEATRYLESKGVTVVLNPSAFMEKTKVDFKEAASREPGFRVPDDTPGKYPKIVKYADGLASIGMDDDSVCYNDRTLQDKIATLKLKEPGRDILVQDFIRGIESTAIVVEMGDDVVALPPVDWVFAKDVPEDQAWLKFSTKFESLAQGTVRFEFVTNADRRKRICEAAVSAFKGLGMQGRGAWGRLDARVESSTGLVYCLEMNHMPALFYGADDALSDDFIIKETYPGGHSAFIDMLLFTKKFQMEHPRCHSTSKKTEYTELAPFPGDDSIYKNEKPVSHYKTPPRTFNSSFYQHVDRKYSINHPSNRSASKMHFSTHENRMSQGLKMEYKPPVSAHKAVGDFEARGVTIAAVYDSSVDKYEKFQMNTQIRRWQIEYFQKYKYHGVTLDLACGVGSIGMLIKESPLNSKLPATECMIHGVDISSLSLQTQWCRNYYSTLQLDYIQEAVMNPESKFYGKSSQKEHSQYQDSLRPVDHITCFGALHFLSRTEFSATLSRMFMLARQSVSFDVDDVSEEYIQLIVDSYGENLRNWNNVAAYREFGTPPGWKKVLEDESLLYHSPSVKIDVRGILVRFERT